MKAQSRADALSMAERYFGSEREVQFDPHVHETFCGDRIVHGQQQHRGLSIFPHSFVITIAADGSVRRDGDDLIDVRGLTTIPTIGADLAVRNAFRHLRGASRASCRRRACRRLGSIPLAAFHLFGGRSVERVRRAAGCD